MRHVSIDNDALTEATAASAARYELLARFAERLGDTREARECRRESAALRRLERRLRRERPQQ